MDVSEKIASKAHGMTNDYRGKLLKSCNRIDTRK